jgi:two-component system, OmpR family, sensor histidine kinase VanS
LNDNSIKTVGTLTKKMLSSFFSKLVVFTVILGIIFLISAYGFSQKIWYGNEFIYPFLHFMNRNYIWVLFLCWMLGFIMIFIKYWIRTLGYVDTIVMASNLLASSEDELIHLPPELKMVESQMNKVKHEALKNERLAREADQRKNDLIVYLAHDLKTPLTSVIGYLTLLKDERQISEELRGKYLSISLGKAERLEELINEFFEITRFNLSSLTLELTRVNLSRMLEQIAFEFNPLFEAKGLQYILNMEENIEIRCDINKIERVFDNLIRNAIFYSFQDTLIEITAYQNDKGVFVKFTNSGNTISKEKLSRIFEQFFRLDSSRGTNTGGAGLGLAIAKEIVELHQGSITAESENEKIDFVVSLPLVLRKDQ